MSNITLHTDSPATTTCVPNVFIDRYMVHASGEFVKIYLYLLRCINGNKSELSISKMADKFEHTEKDIKRALCYWEKLNLLRLEYDNEGDLSGIYFLDSGNVPQPQEVSAPELATAQRIPNTVTGSTTHMPQQTIPQPLPQRKKRTADANILLMRWTISAKKKMSARCCLLQRNI